MLQEAAKRATAVSAPLTEATKGQRVIVSGVDSALGCVINGLRGTTVRWDQQRQLWRVALDTGRVVLQPLANLFSPTELSSRVPSVPVGSGVRLPTEAEPQSIINEKRRGKQPIKRPRQALPITAPVVDDDSDGYGSSIGSSGEDEEALAYAKEGWLRLQLTLSRVGAT